ncbi:hypothetical protein OG552_10260 [Streptomyces sp. NBC_01476]|uniref:hypothetical protein n=1 Tax=Streptomyces sp. NBC_01476 TaxID=2903881 RepID=UPI002E2EFD64|nr:hypothetical protein [Streptomyces sp. NBC_01476]
MNANLPPGWESFTWPIGWQPSAPEALRQVRAGGRALPEQFCLAIRTPDMTGPGGGVVFTYEVRDGAVTLAHIGSVGQEITAHLAQILAVRTPDEWQWHAVAQVAAFRPVSAAEAVPEQANKRYKLTAEHLKKVAEVYSEALDCGEPPTRAVQRHFKTAHSTAAKWIGHARRTGLLPKITKEAAA